jgi:hypothetical protein
MVEVGETIPVRIKRYRDKDDSGIGITSQGKLIIVKDMNGEAETVAAEVIRVLEETLVAKRVKDIARRSSEEVIPPRKGSKRSVYEVSDDDDDDDDDDVDEDELGYDYN